MPVLPKDLPQRLRAAGLKVVIIDGWESRTSAGGWPGVGVLNHHTGAHDVVGDHANDLAYARWMFLEGRADLDPPLCNAALSLEGVVYLGARGNANHAGWAQASGSVAAGDGNDLYWGIEWMLSGTQAIPPRMYEAGVILNAVLLDCMGSSVQAVSCHYQTSVTGKWDIGDPNGISFRGHKVFNVDKFRRDIKQYRRPPKFQASKLKMQHTSLQFSDRPLKQERDLEKIFSRERHILTGTEAGGGEMPMLLGGAAFKHNYKLHRVESLWVAVQKDLVKPRTWRTGYVPVMDENVGSGPHRERGIPWVTFVHTDWGRVSVGAGHYLTQGRNPGDPNFYLNRRYAEKIGEFGRAKGKGSAIAFYSGDQNIPDRKQDTFFGQPFTSCWDELEHWPNTGHGNIDVISSYDGDGRVECVGARVLDDTELKLNTDHYLVEAEYRIRHLNKEK